MRKRGLIPRISLILLILCAIWPTAFAAAGPPLQQGEPLRVVTKSLPPFVIVEGDELTGLSIELWDLIAQRIGVEYEWHKLDTVGELLAAIQDGKADVAIAGITITEQREELLDFSFPYFDSGLQIMVRQESTSPLAMRCARCCRRICSSFSLSLPS